MIKTFLSFLVFGLGLPLFVVAGSCELILSKAADGLKYPARAGDAVKVVLPGESQSLEGVFLGRLLALDGQTKKFAILVPEQKKIHIFRSNEIRVLQGENEISSESLEPVVAGINQEDGTCAAFSIYNCMRQMGYSGHEGNSELAKWLADEAGRHRLLTRSIHDYYIDGNHTDGISEVSGVFGFQHYEIPSGSARELAKGIREYSKDWPILLRFDIGSEMHRTEYEMYDHRDATTYDRRLWLPQRSGERSQGGHMILILRNFTAGNQEWLLVHDPNWTSPRMWPIEELNHRYPANIRAWVVWQEEAN